MALHGLARHGLWWATVSILLASVAERAFGNAPTHEYAEPSEEWKQLWEKGGEGRFVIRRDDSQEHSRLVISRFLLPEGYFVGYSRAHSIALQDRKLRVVHFGLLLTVVIGGGGLSVALVRQRKTRAALSVCAATLLLSAMIGLAMAMAPSNRTPEPDSLFGYDGSDPKIRIEVSLESDVTLILGRDSPKVDFQPETVGR